MTQENHLKAILKKYVLRTDLKTLKYSQKEESSRVLVHEAKRPDHP